MSWKDKLWGLALGLMIGFLVIFFAVAIALLIANPSKAHVPFQCAPYGKVVQERMTKKFEMSQDILMLEMRQIASRDPDPQALFDAYKEYVEFDSERVWPAWTQWLNCVKNYSRLPENLQ